MRRVNRGIVVWGVLVAWAQTASAQANDEARQACSSLMSLSTASFKVETAEWVAASTRPPSPPAAAGSGGPEGANIDAPEHCLFRVTLDPRPSGIPDMSYGTGIELRLPASWNGRLLFRVAEDSTAHCLPAVGSVRGFSSALARGFAVVSSDSGHRGRNAIDGRFGTDQQARLDFAYQAVARTTREAKSLLARFYGRGPNRSYYMGCSTGGREAMLAAQRLPLEFDGVVAGNPSFDLTRIVINQIWSLQTVTRIAPKDANGRPDLSRAFSDAQLQGVSDAILQQCDALDGLRDGMINDFNACRFDPRTMICNSRGASGADHCLTSAQADALKSIFGGAHNSRGEPLYGTFPYDTGIAAPVWRSMHLGTSTSGPANGTLGRDTLRHYVLTPPDPDFDPHVFNFDRDVSRTVETAAMNDAVATLHSAFTGRGGKMIVYHGLSDQAMAAGSLIDWYEHLTPREATGPQSWARLFLVPGMTHCGGGQSTD
jgi:feruloyl esterase